MVLEISFSTEKGVVRFLVESTEPQGQVGVVLDKLDQGEQDLGTVEFSELRHFAKAITGL